jgi:hypothetical protein
MTEENEDNHLRGAYGPAWQRLPSASLNMDIKNRVNAYKGNMTAALQTDAVVDTNLKTLQAKLKLLSLSKNELTSQMPKSEASAL